MTRNWSNQNPNPALKTKTGNIQNNQTNKNQVAMLPELLHVSTA